MSLHPFKLLLIFHLVHYHTVLCQNNETSVNATDEVQNIKPIGKNEKFLKLICPKDDSSRPLFALPCKVSKECTRFGNKNLICCNKKCIQGVSPPPKEPVHTPALFGLIEMTCPREMLPELLEIRECNEDRDCGPRICCPEKLSTGDVVGYCRTPQPILDRLPLARPLTEPLNLFFSYMQCTPPPPPFLDLFPKTCENPLDCFPNLCCQEGGKRFCRPPKRSLLTLLTTVAQRLVPTEAARDFINKIAT